MRAEDLLRGFHAAVGLDRVAAPDESLSAVLNTKSLIMRQLHAQGSPNDKLEEL